MKTILFPTDFSENALHAAQYAAMIAKRLDAEMVLLHSYSMPIPMISEYQLTYDAESYVLQNGKEAEKNLELFTAKLIDKANIPPPQITQMVEYGLVSDIIIDTAKKINADLIVMGTMGASNIIDRWIGTNAEIVMESAECPVWIIPENTPLNIPHLIMYAADFKEDEFLATHKILDIAKPLGATCKVVHIHEYFEMNVNQTIQEKVSDLEAEFENDDITFKDINREDIVEGLETYINTHKPDVLALGVYEKSFLSKIFDSSISKHFVLEAKLPMLIFRK